MYIFCFTLNRIKCDGTSWDNDGQLEKAVLVEKMMSIMQRHYDYVIVDKQS